MSEGTQSTRCVLRAALVTDATRTQKAQAYTQTPSGTTRDAVVTAHRGQAR